MKVVNVPGAGPLGFKDTDSDEFIYATIAKIQDRLKQIDLETRPDPRDIPLGRQFSNSLQRGLGGLGATGSEAMGLGASALGFDEAANRYLAEGKAKRQELEEKYPTSYSSLSGIRGPSDFAGFVAESIGENLPNVGLMALTGGAGSLAARGAAKYGVEAAAARAAAQRGLAGEAAEAYATRLGNRLAPAARSQAGETGFNVGIGAGSFGLNAPETFAGIHEETGGKLEPGLAIGIGGLKALLDGILPARLMSQLGLRGQAKVAEELAARSTIVPNSFKMRLAKEVGKTAATEGITEGVQEALDIIAEQAAGAPGGLDNPKNVDRMLLAAAKGAAGGVGIGAPGALVQTMRETPAKEPELSLNETKKAGSVGPGPAENLAAAMQKRKAQEAITEDEFQLLVQNGVLKDNPQTRASVKFAAPTPAAPPPSQTDVGQVTQAAAAQAALQQQQQQNQQQQRQGGTDLAAWDLQKLFAVRNAELKQPAPRQSWLDQLNAEIAKRGKTPADVNQQLNEAAVADQQGQPNVQPNAQSKSTPPSNVAPPSGESAGVPSGPQGGVSPTGVTSPPPAGVAATERPVQQAEVGEGTQPHPVVKPDQPFFDNGRVMVIADVNGVRVPFYLSTGRGGKKTVPEGKWYPFFGYGADGWINKGTEEDINNFYGSYELKQKAEELNSKLGDIRNLDPAKGDLPFAWDGKASIPDWKKSNSIIVNPNEGFSPVSYNDVGTEANKKYWDNINSTVSKVELSKGKRAFEQALQAFNQTKSPEAFAELTRIYETFVKYFGVNDAYVMGQYAHAQDKMPRPAPVRPKDEGEYEPGTPRQRWNEDDYTPKDAPVFDDLSEKLQNTWAQNPPSIELANQIVRAHRQEVAGRQVLEPVAPGQRVKLNTPEKEWNEQYRQYEFEPEWKKLKPELKVLWKNAHKQNSLSQNLFNHIVDIQVPAIARSQQELLGLPYKMYAPRETGIPSDRAAIVAEKKANSTFKGYFTMPRVVDNLINLAHDIVFGTESVARPKLGLTKEQREEESSLETKNEPKKDTKHYNRTSAADLKKLDEWVRSTLTKDAVAEYDRQLDIQRKNLERLQLVGLTTKAQEKTAKAEKDAADQAANDAEATRQAADRATTPSGPAPVTMIDPAAAQRQLDNIRAINEAQIKRAAERARTPEEIAIERAKEAEGQQTELEIDEAAEEAADAELSNEARKARARADEEAASTAQFLEEDKARRAAAAAARAAAPQPAEAPAITKPEKPAKAEKEEAPAKPSGTLPEGKIVFGEDPGNGNSYLAHAVQNYGDMIIDALRGQVQIEFTPSLEITNYVVNYVNLEPERVSISLNSIRTGGPFKIILGVVPKNTGLNYLDIINVDKDTRSSLSRNKSNPDLEQKFRAAIGNAAVDTFLKGGELSTFITNVIGVDLTPRIEEMYAAFDKKYLVDKPAQYTEGVAYKPLSDKFPISREDFARALGITTHNRAWLATDFNAELADAATRGDMPAVIKALLASKNPIIRDIALRAQATQRFLPSDRIKIKIADEELREVDLEKGRQPGDLAGMFDGGNNTILLNSVYAGSEHTIAHEIVHGLTERIIKTPHPGNQLEGVNRLKRLYKDVLAKAKSVYKTDNLEELPYGFRSESEFIAEGLSNPEFQYLLAALPHEGKTSSMWTEFVRAIAQLLGLKDHNALTELLDIYSVMLEQDLPPNKNVSGAVTAALIGAPPPPNNNYPLVPDDLPANARVPSTVSTPPAALPQVALNRTMVGPMQQLLDAPKNSEFFINAADAAGRWGLSLLPTWNIAANARDMGFDQIGEIENSLRKAGAMKNTLLKRSSDFMNKALEIARSNPAGKKAMDAFVNRASGLGIDVTRSKTPSPEFVKARPDAVNDYISLRAEYEKLEPKFQKLASDLVDQYRQFRDDYFAALKKSVHDQYQDDPVKADKILSGLDEKYKKFNEAYTPFVRIGDYWITYVNPDTGKDVAEAYSTLGAQKTRLGELKKEGIVHVQSFKQTDFRKFSYKSGPVNQFFDEIKANVDKALPIFKDDSPATADRIREAREEMKERLYQASLLLHPESSMLRQFGLERKGTLGYIEDTLAAYDQKAPVYATQISQVANKGEIEHQIDSARKQNASNPDTKMSDIITHVAKIVYGVDTIRADDPLNRIANNVNRLGFTYYMGFNPASALVNMLQTPTVMFPLLAGEFHGLGQTKIMGALFSAMNKIIGGSLGQQTYGEKLVESAEAKIDAAVAKGKTREEAIAALPEMERVFLSFRDQGILNAGDPSHDFGSVTKYGSGETSAFGKGVRAFTKYSAIMFQRAEAINREAGALATYQLMKQRLSGKAGMNDQEKYVEAIRKATEMVTKAHGDYQHGLAPKIFLSPAMRVIFMFKKFPAHMAALYVRLFKEIFSGANSDVRKVARIQFAGLMGMSAIFAGTMGMPFYYIVRDMMNLMLDDEDDPFDFDFAFYNYLSDMWGQSMANRITRGWLGDLGGDVASKVGYASSPLLGGTKQLPFIGGLLGLRDGKNTASTEDDLKNYIAEAAGASAGMALQIARGVDKLAQGDVYRFLEGVTPMAAMRNIAKSIRLSTEGALTTRGEPIIEDVSLVETALQAVGITPQRLASQYQLNAWQKDIEKQLLDRRQGLLNQYFNARTRGDFETASDVREEMKNFSLMNPEKGLKITEDTIAASARTRAKQSKETKAGIYLSKPFRQRFADVPVYAEE